MHLAPKQILVNAHVNLIDELTNAQIIGTIAEIESAIKKAEPKVDMIFLKTAGITEKSQASGVDSHETETPAHDS